MAGRGTDSLTDKQRAFVREYLKDSNGTAAARRAGYSERTANEQAARLLAKPSIASAVAAGQAELDEYAGLTSKRIIDGLLAETEREGDGCTQSARVAAWTALARIRGLFTERVEHRGSVELHLTW